VCLCRSAAVGVSVLVGCCRFVSVGRLLLSVCLCVTVGRLLSVCQCWSSVVAHSLNSHTVNSTNVDRPDVLIITPDSAKREVQTDRRGEVASCDGPTPTHLAPSVNSTVKNMIATSTPHTRRDKPDHAYRHTSKCQNRYIWLSLLRLNPPTDAFPCDDLRKSFSECQRMAKLANGVEILPKISTG